MGKKRIGLKNQNTGTLLARLQEYYALSIGVLQDFGGPSVHFHQQALIAQAADFLGERHIEMIYATLASWGMHRMGDPEDTKAKMVEYPDFRSSILACRTDLTALRNERFENVTQDASEFFTKNGKYRLPQVPTGTDKQFEMFVELSLKMKALFDQCDWCTTFHVNGQGFNTSYPKIVDNLIMAFVKAVPSPAAGDPT